MLQPHSNLDLSRSLSRMPRWSSARNFFSNYSKVTSPTNEQASSVRSNLNQIVQAHINKEFGYQEDEYIYIGYPGMIVPKTINTEYGDLEYIGEYGSSFVGDYPFKGGELTPILAPFDTAPISLPVVFLSEGVVFIKAPGASISTPKTFVIYGLDKNGKELSEPIIFNSDQPYVTNIRYKSITRVAGDGDFEIFDHLDLVDNVTYNNIFGPQKRITDRDGLYFQPKFEIDGKTIYIKNSNKISQSEEYCFTLPRVPEKIFISSNLDIIYLSDNKLYSSKFYLDYETKKQYNSTYNNNSFLAIDSETPTLNDEIRLTISVSDIRSAYGVNKFRIKKITKDQTTYIGSLGQDLLSDSWLTSDSAGPKIYIPIIVTEEEDATFVLEIFKANKEFCCGYIFNHLIEHQLLEDVENLVFRNHKLIVYVNNEASFYTPHRPYYQSALNQDRIPILVFTRDYQTLDV